MRYKATATRFAPFGYSLSRHAPLLHSVARVDLRWYGRQRDPAMHAQWLCGSSSGRPVLLGELTDELTRCWRCELAAPFHPAPSPCVYYAERNGRIKIGTSTDLPRRLYGLGWPVPLAVEPGGFDLERERHDQFASLRIDLASEWFEPGADLLAHIASLNSASAFVFGPSIPGVPQPPARVGGPNRTAGSKASSNDCDSSLRAPSARSVAASAAPAEPVLRR